MAGMEVFTWITVRARTEKSSEGRPIRLAGLVWDITKEKKRSEELKEGEKRFRDLANTLPQLAWMADSTGYIFWYNQRWYDYTGTTLEQMLGWGWQSVHDPEHTDRVVEKWVESLGTGKAWEDTFPLRGMDGTFRWFLSKAQPILNGDGQVYRWFGTNTDITAQRESEIALQLAVKKANEASELKSAFLANMSHEIRTPLGAILGFTDLLQDHQLAPDEKKSFHEIVKRNGEQLSSLINDILDLSKVEAGQFKAEVGPTNIRDLLEEVCSTMVVKAQERRLNYRWQMNGDVPNVVATDPLRVRQVLMNVIGNAIKFTHDGNVDVTASLGSDKSIRFTVTDTGIGLSFEQADKLFQPFSQADPSITRKYGGTGLGLVLSRQLARALGGDVILKSSVTGKGTAFEFWIKDQIPANEQPEMPAETKAKRAPNSTDPSNSIENLKGVRVLLVDDSPDNRHLISRILKKQGAVVSEAVNGAEGLDAAFEGDFDIILMDLQMPVLDGYSAIQKLRESNWKNPIIALTAHALSEVRTKTLKVGANDYMTKPLKADELVFKIKLYTAASTRK